MERGNLLARQPDQRIAATQRVIQKREGMILGQRRQPQAELAQVHRQRVLVHSVQTPLGDQPPRVQHLILIRRQFRHAVVELPRFDQFIAKLPTGLDQKRRGAHRGIADFEREDLFGGGGTSPKRERVNFG